jgi:hypothetical protein
MLQPRWAGPTLRCAVSTRQSSSGAFKSLELRFSSTTAVPRGRGKINAYENSEKTNAVKQKLAEHPLSVMPTHMLLRSLFIATVSSNKLLLLPSLRLLSFFAKPNRSLLFDVNHNLVLKALLKRMLYNQFCAGETEGETRRCVQQLKDLGFKGVILTYARETVFETTSKRSEDLSSTAEKVREIQANDTEIETWRVGTLKTAALISEGDILAIK